MTDNTSAIIILSMYLVPTQNMGARVGAGVLNSSLTLIPSCENIYRDVKRRS